MSGLRERKKAEKRQQIAQAAGELFAERGFDSTTTRAIAERAGVATGTVFLYAKNKSALVHLVWRDAMGEELDEAFASLPGGGSLPVRLGHIFGRFLRRYAADPELSRIYLREVLLPASDADPSLLAENAALDQHLFEKLVGLIEQARTEGEVRDGVAAVDVARQAFSIYLLAAIGLLRGAFDLRAAISALVHQLELLANGYGPPPTATTRSPR